MNEGYYPPRLPISFGGILEWDELMKDEFCSRRFKGVRFYVYQPTEGLFSAGYYGMGKDFDLANGLLSAREAIKICEDRANSGEPFGFVTP